MTFSSLTYLPRSLAKDPYARGWGLDPRNTPSAAGDRDHQIEVEDYFTLESIIDCAVAPDGSRVAYTQQGWGEPDERRTTDLWVVDTRSRRRTRLTFDRVGARDPKWSADGRFIYFTARFERPGADVPPWDGSTQVWRLSPAGWASCISP